MVLKTTSNVKGLFKSGTALLYMCLSLVTSLIILYSGEFDTVMSCICMYVLAKLT